MSIYKLQLSLYNKECKHNKLKIQKTNGGTYYKNGLFLMSRAKLFQMLLRAKNNGDEIAEYVDRLDI